MTPMRATHTSLLSQAAVMITITIATAIWILPTQTASYACLVKRRIAQTRLEYVTELRKHVRFPARGLVATILQYLIMKLTKPLVMVRTTIVMGVLMKTAFAPNVEMESYKPVKNVILLESEIPAISLVNGSCRIIVAVAVHGKITHARMTILDARQTQHVMRTCQEQESVVHYVNIAPVSLNGVAPHGLYAYPNSEPDYVQILIVAAPQRVSRLSRKAALM